MDGGESAEVALEPLGGGSTSEATVLCGFFVKGAEAAHLQKGDIDRRARKGGEQTRLTGVDGAGAPDAEAVKSSTCEAEPKSAGVVDLSERFFTPWGQRGRSHGGVGGFPGRSNNARMHSRSRFFGRTLDFAQMAKTCPYIAPFLVPLPVRRRKRKLGEEDGEHDIGEEAVGDDSCKFTFDFKTADAQRLLTKATFKCLYGLEFSLPPDGALLVPTLPSRANYLHFLADLLSESEGRNHFARVADPSSQSDPPRGEEVRVLDVGVGGNCVYPLLGVSEFGWSFIGSDVERHSLEVCFLNISKNGLCGRVSLRMQRDRNRVFRGVVEQDEIFAASVCNPPFYDERPDAPSQRLENCPFRDRGGAPHELTCEGGEMGFVLRMLDESVLFFVNFIWFSTLVARAATRDALKAKIHEGMRRVSKAQTERMQQQLEAIADRWRRRTPAEPSAAQMQQAKGQAKSADEEEGWGAKDHSLNSLTDAEQQLLEEQLSGESKYTGQAFDAHPREIRIFDLWQGRQTRWVVCWTFWTAEQRKTLKHMLFSARNSDQGEKGV